MQICALKTRIYQHIETTAIHTLLLNFFSSKYSYIYLTGNCKNNSW